MGMTTKELAKAIRAIIDTSSPGVVRLSCVVDISKIIDDVIAADEPRIVPNVSPDIGAVVGDDTAVIVIRRRDIDKLSRTDSVFVGIDPATHEARYLTLAEIVTPGMGHGGGIGSGGGSPMFPVSPGELITMEDLVRWLTPMKMEGDDQ